MSEADREFLMVDNPEGQTIQSDVPLFDFFLKKKKLNKQSQGVDYFI